MKLFNTIAASVAVAMAAGVAQADVNSQLASLQAQVNQLQSQVNGMGSSSMAGVVGVSPALSWQMMGNGTGVGREMYLLQARQAGLNTPVTIGGFAQADVVYQHTNNDGVFNNLPFSYGNMFTTNAPGSNSSSATRLMLSNANLSVTAAMGQWVTGYIQTGAQELGQSGSDTLNVQDAYIVVGNLAKNPVYGFAGKKDIDFGSFQTVDMYNQPLTTALFAALGNTVGVGVNAYGFNGTISAMNGGSNSSTVTNGGASGSNLSTTGTAANFAKNYAVNLSYGMTNSGVTWNAGAGYLRGTQFLNTSTSSNFPNGQTNGAWDVNGKVSVAGFDFLAEYVATTSKTYGVPGFNSARNTPSTATAWSLGADYNFPVMGLNSVVSLEYSQAKLNGGSSDQYKPSQVVAGYKIQPVNNVWTGIEYSYNKGNLSAQTNGGSSLNTSTVLLDVTAAF